MVTGNTYQGTNIRNSPIVASGTWVKSVDANVNFTGNLVTGEDGRQWIELASLDGKATIGLFLAAWVVNYTVVVVPVDPPVLVKEFPEFFILESPTGERKRYNQVV